MACAGVRHRRVITGSCRGGLLALALLTAGCVTTPIQPLDEPPEQALPTAEVEPARAPGDRQATTLPPPSSAAPFAAVPAGEPLAVVLNDPDSRHLEILQVFSARLGRPYRIYNLAHRDATAVLQALEQQAPVEVVALGPVAYELTRTVPGLDVFYAGVLDPGRTTQGVDALPPFTVQLDYWKGQAPDLRHLGVIGGSGMSGRMAALASAAADRDMTLEQRTVHSDTEMLLAFRAMVPHIDGFVFLPDETVLSPRVIQQVMNHGRRNDVQILVYSPVMFNLGASLYLQSDPVRVADALVTLVNDPATRPEVTGMRSRSRLTDQLELSAADVTAFKGGN